MFNGDFLVKLIINDLIGIQENKVVVEGLDESNGVELVEKIKKVIADEGILMFDVSFNHMSVDLIQTMGEIGLINPPIVKVISTKTALAEMGSVKIDESFRFKILSLLNFASDDLAFDNASPEVFYSRFEEIKAQVLNFAKDNETEELVLQVGLKNYSNFKKDMKYYTELAKVGVKVNIYVASEGFKEKELEKTHENIEIWISDSDKVKDFLFIVPFWNELLFAETKSNGRFNGVWSKKPNKTKMIRNLVRKEIQAPIIEERENGGVIEKE